MHIVQLANLVTPTSGGIRVTIGELARRYVAAGHRCTTIVPGPVDTTVVDGDHVRHEVAAPVIPGSGGYRMVVDTRPVDALLGELAPDVIELSDKATLVGPARRARRCGARVVLISHERLDAAIHRLTKLPSGTIARRWNRRLATGADAIVCASRYAAAEWAGIAPVHRIPLGVDTDRFAPADTSRSSPLRIVVVSRLSSEKRVDVVPAVSDALIGRGVDHAIDVYGTGPLHGRLDDAARAVPIVLHGHVADRGQLARAVATSDLMLAPGPVETFGLAALEALAAGTPVVVPTGGALAELLAPGAGIAAPLQPDALAAAIDSLRAGDRAAQRTAARARALQFTWDATAARLLALYDGQSRSNL